MKKGFYMIYVEGEKNPTYKHDTIESVKQEAIRLADLTGKDTYILAAVRVIKSRVEDITPHELLELPF